MIRLAATIAASLAASSSLLALCLAGGCVVRTPSLLARTSVPLPSGPPSSPPSDPAASPPDDDSQVIEAGCSFRANDIRRGEPGMVRQVVCPAGCDKDAPVYGTDSYTSDTPICAAAMHAGAISARGGAATVVLEPGRPAYRGSKRNGIQSHDWGTYRASYRFEGVRSAPPVAEAAPAPVVIEAGCSFSANDIHGEPGSVHRVSCPAGCSKEDGIWGSDPYTSASPICLAAIHAGVTGESGGEFTVILDDGKPAYRGSKRNGVQSHDWGAYRASYRLRR